MQEEFEYLGALGGDVTVVLETKSSFVSATAVKSYHSVCPLFLLVECPLSALLRAFCSSDTRHYS